MNKEFVFSLVFFIVLLVVAAGFVSAQANFIEVANNNTTVNRGDTVSITFRLQESGIGNMTNITFLTPVTLTSGANSFNSQTSVTGAITELAQNATSSVMTLSFNVPANQAPGTYTGSLTVEGVYTNKVSNTLPISIVVSDIEEFCEFPNPRNNLRITDIELNNDGYEFFDGFRASFGNDDEWSPLDIIEVSVDVENRGNDDIDNIELEWALFDTSKNDFITTFDEVDQFDLRDGDEDTLTFKIDLARELDDSDLEDLNGRNVELVIRVTGFDREDEQDICDSETQRVEVLIEDDFVIVNDLVFPTTLQCGEEFTVNGELFNAGDRDQDNVEIEVFNSELNIDERLEVGDINAFRTEDFRVPLVIPEDADEKSYTLRFTVFDEDGDVFENSDNDESEFLVPITVSGSCGVAAGKVLVSAVLESSAKAGKDLIVRATVTNLETSSRTFRISATSFSSWAQNFEVDQPILFLGGGQSGDVVFTFDVRNDASGENSFNIEVASDGEVLVLQPVAFSIEPRGSIITGGVIGGVSTPVFVLAILIFIVLVIIIIVMAMRLSRSETHSEEK